MQGQPEDLTEGGIEIENVQECLDNDSNGEYRSALLQELDDTYAEVSQHIASGLTPDDYQTYSSLQKAIGLARKFVNDYPTL